MVLSLAACTGNEEEQTPAQKTAIRMATLKGPTGIGTAKLMADNDAGTAANQYTVTLCTDPTEVVSGIVAGTYDVAACPLNMASVLYNKTNGNIQMLAINTLGTMYLLSTQELTDISELAGKTIISAGQGATPEYVLNYLLEKNGLTDKVTVEYKSEHAEVATLAAAATADDDTFYLLPEPNVTSALLQNSALKNVLDLSKAFETASGVSLAMGCIVAKKISYSRTKRQLTLSWRNIRSPWNTLPPIWMIRQPLRNLRHYSESRCRKTGNSALQHRVRNRQRNENRCDRKLERAFGGVRTVRGRQTAGR